MAGTKPTSPVVISVLAANGQQSSSVLAHLLSRDQECDYQLHLRAIVRDPSKYRNPFSGRTQGQNTPNKEPDEVIAGDMNSAESLDDAFRGTDVLWAMTSANPTKGIEEEISLGKTIIDAFVRSIKTRTTLSHKPLLLFSSTIDVDTVTKGEIKMINATSKARIETYLHSLPQDQQDAFRVTFVHPGMFMQNWTTYQKPTIDDEGVYHFAGSTRPDVQIPCTDITDLGPLVWHLIETAYFSDHGAKAYDKYDRATIRLYGEYLSHPQLVDQFSKTTGSPAVYDYMSNSKFLSLLFGGTEAEAKAQLDPVARQNNQETMITMIGDMYKLFDLYGYYGAGAPGAEAYKKDIRGQKVIEQQPTRRTTWVEFVKNNFNTTSEQDKAAAVLSLPANFPGLKLLTPAQKFLYEHLSYFVKVCQAGPDVSANFEQDVLPKFHPKGVVEFPYFPKALRGMMPVRPLTSNPADDGALLSGHAEILTYFKDWRQTFNFTEGELQSLSVLSSSTSGKLATSDGAAIEARLIGSVTLGGQSKPYVQDYMCFAYLDQEGKVVRYQEYWDPTRFT